LKKSLKQQQPKKNTPSVRKYHTINKYSSKTMSSNHNNIVNNSSSGVDGGSNGNTTGSCSTWRSLIYIPAKVDTGVVDGTTLTSTTTIIEPATLQVLDQLLLPHTISYITINNIPMGWKVIHDMNIRGAPLIAIVAILSLAIDLQWNHSTQKELQQIESMNTNKSSLSNGNNNLEDTFDSIQSYIYGKLDYLSTSRPTAVNLFNALQDVKDLISSLKQPQSKENNVTTPKVRIVNAIVQYAEQMLHNDEADCRAIGQYGAQEILLKHQNQNNTNNNNNNNKVSMMTICNTGSLATANYGTALGVIRSIHALQQLEQVIVLETRPYNQGSRLTAFECIQDQLSNPILICDNMITAFIQKFHQTSKSSSLVIVVGADRIVQNGDTANKIGTFQLAVLAHYHHIPFYVAAPTTTFDIQTTNGSLIHIEERSAIEVITSSNAPKNMPVWNPA
jgi:S-methyl-5-thioribose-1-phosphate isomerase